MKHRVTLLKSLRDRGLKKKRSSLGKNEKSSLTELGSQFKLRSAKKGPRDSRKSKEKKENE